MISRLKWNGVVKFVFFRWLEFKFFFFKCSNIWVEEFLLVFSLELRYLECVGCRKGLGGEEEGDRIFFLFRESVVVRGEREIEIGVG